MRVVINEFEVLPAEPPAPQKEAGDSASEAAPHEKIEPCMVASAMRSIDIQALRVWAH